MHQSSNLETEVKFRIEKPSKLKESNIKIKEEPEIEDHSNDAGNKQDDHYKKRLSPIRYKLRSLLLPIIRYETEILYNLQSILRNPIFDFYFAWTANLASHTFYVLMLPPANWFGGSKLARDLVYVLGLGIYFTGFLKDYFCLPRPRSPPLHRITMSSYTTQEYGFPSSHSANATAVTLVVLTSIINLKESIEPFTYYSLIIGLSIYYISLIFGRLYCGMHGFLDIFVGSSVGILVFLFRYYLGKSWDDLLLGHGMTFGIFAIIGIFLYLIHIYSEPVDDCPCFDDSVAFVGVLIGLDMSHLIARSTKHFYNLNTFGDYYLIPFSIESGFLKIGLRFITGVTLVVIWKTISKPIIFTILPPIYKFIGVYLPRKNYISTAHTSQTYRNIRSTSISNDVSQIGNINNFIKGVSDRQKLDNVGPSSDIDYYEMIDYNRSNDSTNSSLDPEKYNFKSGVFKYRYDVEIIGRLIVYAGVSMTAIWGFYYVSNYLNI
ncbi:LCB3 [Candida pseudojiufengensis]|uniref:LCB3 n=1 Tax=Candida pseudojiufengensis TaxID=497109 RepID=UPI0022248D9E|nr:LCB3 [Candida pseudojiufengensis]KAI5966348.1 LCB3 [Candida pseudojiufengensis]